MGELSTESPLRLCDQRPLPGEIKLPTERDPSETNPAKVTIKGKTYEVISVSGLLSYRLSPESEWTACSAEFAQLIRDSQSMPEVDVPKPQASSKTRETTGENGN